MYGKLINNKLVFVKNTIKTDSGFVTNPTREQLLSLGYKEVIYNEKPEFNKEIEKLVEQYIDGTNITVNYIKVALSTEEHNLIIQQEILNEEEKITNRNIRMAIRGDEFAINKIDEIETNIQALREKLIIEDIPKQI